MLGQIGITIFDDENKFVVDDILDNILHPQYLSIIETIDTETYNSYTKYVEQLSSCDDDRYNEKLKILRDLIRETTDFNLRFFYVYILARCLQKCGDYEKIFKYIKTYIPPNKGPDGMDFFDGKKYTLYDIKENPNCVQIVNDKLLEHVKKYKKVPTLLCDHQTCGYTLSDCSIKMCFNKSRFIPWTHYYNGDTHFTTEGE